jgi:hypothetical protein
VDALKDLVGLPRGAKGGKPISELVVMATTARQAYESRQKWPPESPLHRESQPEKLFSAKMAALRLWMPTQLLQAQDRVLKFQKRAMGTCPVPLRSFAQTQISDMEILSKSIQESLKKQSDLTSPDRIDAMLTIMHFCLRLSVSQRYAIEQSKASEALASDLSEVKQVLAAVVRAGPRDGVEDAQNVLDNINPLLPSSSTSNEGLIGQGTYWAKYSMKKSDTDKFLLGPLWQNVGLKSKDNSCSDLFEALIGVVCPPDLRGDLVNGRLADFRLAMGYPTAKAN